MTSHSYYKERLGFDPNEAQYESSTTTRRSGSRSSNHHHHHHHHTQSRSSHHHHAASATHQSSASPARISISPGGASLDHYAADISPAKKPKHTSSALQQPQGGYEDALTQFKGTMSIWEYFIENWDILRKSFRAPCRWSRA